MYHTSCDFLADFLHCLGPNPEGSQILCGDTLYDELGTEALWELADMLDVVSFNPPVYPSS